MHITKSKSNFKIGEFDDINVILVRGRIPASASDKTAGLELNRHKLRFPLNELNATIYGDIFCYRLSAEAVHLPFTAQEYQTFSAKPVTEQEIEEYEQAMQQKQEEADNEDCDLEQEENANNDADADAANNEDGVFEMNTDLIRSVIVTKIRKDFPLKFGRQPTEDEIEDFYERTLQAFTANFGDEDLNNQQEKQIVIEDIQEEDQNENEDDEDYV
jgi:hypothetical protein